MQQRSLTSSLLFEGQNLLPSIPPHVLLFCWKGGMIFLPLTEKGIFKQWSTPLIEHATGGCATDLFPRQQRSCFLRLTLHRLNLFTGIFNPQPPPPPPPWGWGSLPHEATQRTRRLRLSLSRLVRSYGLHDRSFFFLRIEALSLTSLCCVVSGTQLYYRAFLGLLSSGSLGK